MTEAASKPNRYWILTIPQHAYLPYLPPSCQFIRGQLERGDNTGYLHWQLVVAFKKPIRLSGIKKCFGDGVHAEPSRSAAANDYVWKDETRIDGTQFELGKLAFKRNCAADWESVRAAAKRGCLDEIEADVYIRHYGNLRRIAQDHLAPVGFERQVYVYWGRTGTGKSRRAWEEATNDAYPKDPRTKFWDGYQGHDNVVIDEFRGGIDIAHLLRWFDRYPVIVEVKGSSTVLKAKKIWITSNLSPDDWFKEVDAETQAALRRRFTQVIHFN